MSRAQLVITTGGLGPTVDDMTRQGVAKATDRSLVFHQTLLDGIAERFAGFRVNMTENNKRQAYLPDQAVLVENAVGTAPSFIVEHEGSAIISLPGVPREMKYLMTEKIIPYLLHKYDLGIIKAKILRTAGIGESSLDDLIGVDLLEGRNPTVGLAAHSGVVDMRITAKAPTREEADTMIAGVEQQLRGRVGEYIFGVDKEQIEAALLERMEAANARLAISETGIEGAVSARLKKVTESDGRIIRSDVYLTPDDLKAALAFDGEPDLRELAQTTARQICLESGAELGIAVVSDPSRAKDEADADIGTAVAVYYKGESSSRVYGFGGQADEAKLWTSTWTMARAWQMLR